MILVFKIEKEQIKVKKYWEPDIPIFLEHIKAP